MEMSDTAKILWESGGIGAASSVVVGLLLYSVIRFLKFGSVSVVRSVLTSLGLLRRHHPGVRGAGRDVQLRGGDPLAPRRDRRDGPDVSGPVR